MNSKEIAERDAAILRLFCENNNNSQIARKFGLSAENVRLRLMKQGIKNARGLQPIFRQWSRPDYKPRLTTRERFWTCVNKSPGWGMHGDCWIWTAGRNPSGHGRMRAFGKPQYAHHLSWLFTYRKVASQWILHRCGNASCCRPDHLYEGTPAQNAQDRERHAIMQGINIHAAKNDKLTVN